MIITTQFSAYLIVKVILILDIPEIIAESTIFGIIARLSK